METNNEVEVMKTLQKLNNQVYLLDSAAKAQAKKLDAIEKQLEKQKGFNRKLMVLLLLLLLGGLASFILYASNQTEWVTLLSSTVSFGILTLGSMLYASYE